LADFLASALWLDLRSWHPSPLLHVSLDSIPSLAFASPVTSGNKMASTSRTSLSLGRSPSRASKASSLHEVTLNDPSRPDSQEITSPLPVLTKSRPTKDGVELGELNREGSKTAGGTGELGSPTGSTAGDMPGTQQLDHKGRRPLRMGTAEEKWVLAALFFTLCQSKSLLPSSLGLPPRGELGVTELTVSLLGSR
jgi:hypothetical protein